MNLTDLIDISDILLKHNMIKLRVVSGSMHPAVRAGDLLHVEPVPVEELQPGDILLCHNHGQLICHRLAGKFTDMGKPYVITKGDISPKCDPPLAADRVLGRVTGIRRGSRLRYVWLSKIKPEARKLVRGWKVKAGSSYGKVIINKSRL